MFRTFILLLGLWGVVGAQAPRTWLGVGLVDVPADVAQQLKLPAQTGVMIAQIVPGSPAGKAGLRREEVILRYNDQPVSGVQQMGKLVRETIAGQVIPVVLVSTEGKRTVPVRIEEIRPPAAPRPPKISEIEPLDFDIPRPVMVVRNRALGAVLEPLDGQLASFFGVKEGVLVRDVRDGSAAAQAGLQAGDVIVEAGQEPVRHPEQLRRAMNQRSGDSLELRVLRERKSRTVKVPIESGSPFGRPFTQRFQ